LRTASLSILPGTATEGRFRAEKCAITFYSQSPSVKYFMRPELKKQSCPATLKTRRQSAIFELDPAGFRLIP